MKLQVPFVQLPLTFDADALRAEVEAIPEDDWRPHPQGFPGNSMLPLVAVGGDPANEAFSGVMQPTPALQSSPRLLQAMHALGAVVGRSRLMRLAGNAEVTRHVDQGYYWAERVRVHVPITTQPTVRFECGDAAVNMAAGECWIFDTWRQHRVLNDAGASRIHLVVDTVGGERFWDLVGRGRAVGAPSAPWAPQHVTPGPPPDAPLPCESRNVPVVMSPWELNHLLGILFADAVPGPALPVVQQSAARLVRAWRGEWARHGDAPEGHDAFRALLGRFLAEVQGPGEAVMLRNHVSWFGAMSAMLAQVAVGNPANPRATAEMQRAMGDNA